MSTVTPLTENEISIYNKLLRAVWQVVWLLLYRPSPVPLHAWRRLLLRLFGAKLASNSYQYPSARIWAPWNLKMHERSCLSHFVDCYSVDKVEIGPNATVSQYSYLCTASHDFQRRSMPLVTAPIRIEKDAWVTACVFIGPGVTVGEGAVVGAHSTVVRDVEPWAIVAGHPAVPIGRRELRE